jgi:hydroxyacylglutathione hydrolase
MSAQIHQFQCLSDNFGVLIHDPETGATASIDAPEAGPILAALAEKGWTLTDILVTHHHPDHVQAIPDLKARFPQARVTGPGKDIARIPEIENPVVEGDMARVGAMTAKVIEAPGHTSGHIAYWFEAEKAVFVGDVLFALGCGRVFEGTMDEMHASLQKLAALPPDTRVWCGHEYTLSNARFAVTIDPANAALKARLKRIEALRAEGKFTLPTTIGEELATNPFLRGHDPAIKAHLNMASATPAAVFAEIRERKNRA